MVLLDRKDAMQCGFEHCFMLVHMWEIAVRFQVIKAANSPQFSN